MRKSYFAGFLLTIFFGPFGLLYASGRATVVMFVLTVVFYAVGKMDSIPEEGGLMVIESYLLSWMISIPLSGFMVGRWNRRVTTGRTVLRLREGKKRPGLTCAAAPARRPLR